MKRLLVLGAIVVPGLLVAVWRGMREQNAVGERGRFRTISMFVVDRELAKYTEACERTFHDSEGCICFAASLERDFGKSGAAGVFPKISSSFFRSAHLTQLSEEQLQRVKDIYEECGLAE